VVPAVGGGGDGFRGAEGASFTGILLTVKVGGQREGAAVEREVPRAASRSTPFASVVLALRGGLPDDVDRPGLEAVD
jgi:hypothetical protein